jgi:hypothetical protein
MRPVKRSEDRIVDLQLLFSSLPLRILPPPLKVFILKVQRNIFDIAQLESSQNALLLRGPCCALELQPEIGFKQLTKLKREAQYVQVKGAFEQERTLSNVRKTGKWLSVNSLNFLGNPD